jgi:hypothetical protein
VPYKVLDIFKDLPRTNCGDCGKGSCFAFASAVYLEAFPLERCPHLDTEHRETMQQGLDAGHDLSEGRRPASSEQALRALLVSLQDADLTALTERSAGEYVAGPPEGVRIAFLDGSYLATRGDVMAIEGRPPSHWVKIFILIYLTRASGRPQTGEWIAYRSLPNTVSKATSFEECLERIAGEYGGDLEGLDEAVAAVGGIATDPGSADRAYRFRVLPRVGALLLFWDQEEEFSARASLLLDRRVLDYLDQEALVFMAEALVGRLLGEDLNKIVA